MRPLSGRVAFPIGFLAAIGVSFINPIGAYWRCLMVDLAQLPNVCYSPRGCELS